MWLLRQQLDLSPVQELVQGSKWVLGYGTLVHITPHLQPHESHTDIQSPVELKFGVGSRERDAIIDVFNIFATVFTANYLLTTNAIEKVT